MYLDGSILSDYFVAGVILLIIASFVAGFIDSVAGGAGLVLVPSFILAGLPPQIALGQEKLVSTIGTIPAIFNFLKSRQILWDYIFFGVPLALLGSFAGAKFILFLDPNIVGKLIVVLMPIGLSISIMPKNKNNIKIEDVKFKRYFLYPFVFFIIGFYDGFFGPGTGSLLILALHLIMKMSLLNASATSKIFNFASNIGAFIAFFMAGKMLFLIGIPMAIASMFGNYIGSHLTIKNGDKFIKPILFGMIFLLFLSLIYKYFIKTA